MISYLFKVNLHAKFQVSAISTQVAIIFLCSKNGDFVYAYCFNGDSLYGFEMGAI